MGNPFIGSEAVAAGRLSKYQLRSRNVAVHHDVYLPRESTFTATSRAKAAWLWSGRAAVVAGRSAAALHGAKWVADDAPAQLLFANRRPPRGIHTWSDRYADDEIETVSGVVVTTPARTALDVACHHPFDDAVAAIDALARTTKLRMADVESLARRYRGRRGIRTALEVLDLVDAGAESPQETRVRLLLIRAGYPRPETQIAVYDEYGQLIGELDMGWHDVMVGVDYEGKHHWSSPAQIRRDIRRHEGVTERGWIDVRVTAEDTDGAILGRVKRAWQRRT